MKLSIAVLTLIFSSNFASANPTSTSDPSDMECINQGSRALLKHLKTDNFWKLSFYNGAIVGDGVNAIEIETYQVEGVSGLYKVDLTVDGCQVRNIERINN